MNPSTIGSGPGRDAKRLAAILVEQLSTEAVVRVDEPMARRTTLRVGGPADFLVEPASEQDLARVLEFRTAQALPFLVIGRGSNLLVKDGGFRGILIALCHPEFTRIEVAGESLRCGAGAKLKDVAAAAKRSALEGLEFLEGIPGSVGGALRMNAGAMGGEIFQVVNRVRLMDSRGEISELTAFEMQPAYRSCPMLEQRIALAATLRGRPGARDRIEQRMNDFSRRRWASQPAAPSAGCMFKNPASIPAGKLIEELGLKGTRVGGAMVSLEHGNFIVNDRNAVARDVLELIDLVRKKALDERGIQLEPEVRIVGE